MGIFLVSAKAMKDITAKTMQDIIVQIFMMMIFGRIFVHQYLNNNDCRKKNSTVSIQRKRIEKGSNFNINTFKSIGNENNNKANGYDQAIFQSTEHILRYMYNMVQHGTTEKTKENNNLSQLLSAMLLLTSFFSFLLY